jgi:hypothetical protein
MKRIIIRLGIVLIGFILSQKSFSQENYLQGYIIKDKSDSIWGFIDYRNWAKNPQIISFKEQIEYQPTSYTPTDLIEFGVKDEIYVSGIVNIETSPIGSNELKEDPALQLESDSAFLQTLFKGNKCLYYYKTQKGKDNFYIKQNSSFELLPYKKYLKEHEYPESGRYSVVENKSYLGLLMLYFEDCPSIQSKIENASYDIKSLKKIFSAYYNCTEDKIEFQQKKEKSKIEIGLITGASVSTLEFKSDAFDYLVNADFNQSINFTAGLYFDIILPRNYGKWSINNELLFSSYNVKGRSEDFENEDYYTITTTEFGFSYIKLNNLIRFKYPIGRIFIFFNGGISNGIAISETNFGKEEIRFYTDEKVNEGKALDGTRKHEQGVIIGTGAKYNKLSLEVRYETANGMSMINGLSSTSKRLYFLLGYRL